MASDPSQQQEPSSPERESAPVRDKVRIRFRKGGDLRLVSHHDLMQCFERMLRRATLPFHATEGFNPKPRMVFALSLALGIVGCEEVLDLELDARLPPEEIHERLVRQAPAGLDILSVGRVERKSKAHVRRVCYRVTLPAERLAGLPERIAALLAASNCWIERSRPERRRLDLRPYVRDLRLCETTLEMDFHVTPTGAARPDEVMAVLGLRDVIDEGAVLERTTLELEEEAGPAVVPPQPVTATETVAHGEGPGRSRPTPLLPGPLSFES